MLRELFDIGKRGDFLKKIKFLHCADLHLDSPFVGLSTLPATVYEKDFIAESLRAACFKKIFISKENYQKALKATKQFPCE